MAFRLRVLIAFLLAFAPQTAFACSYKMFSDGGMILGAAFLLLLLVGTIAEPIAEVMKRGTKLVAALFPLAGLIALLLALLNIDGVFYALAQLAHERLKPEVYFQFIGFREWPKCLSPFSAATALFGALLVSAFWLMLFRQLVWKNEKYRKIVERVASFRLGIAAVLVLWASVHFYLWFVDDARWMKINELQSFPVTSPKEAPKK